jgi:Rrf2 family protein
MSQALRISEAASLALHSMALLAARSDKPLATHEIAGELRVSEAHLSKVLQRLAKGGLVAATRGPGGGFELAKAPGDISLLEVYETIDGPLGCDDCLLGEPTCRGEACLLGDLIKSVNEQMRTYLSATHLADVTTTYRARAAARPA